MATLTKTHALDELHLASARDRSSPVVDDVPDQPIDGANVPLSSGERFPIEEELLLDESPMAFNWNDQLLLQPLPFPDSVSVMAVATLLWTVQGQSGCSREMPLMLTGNGSSYLRIWLELAQGVLHQGWRLFPTISLHGYADPDPALA